MKISNIASAIISAILSVFAMSAAYAGGEYPPPSSAPPSQTDTATAGATLNAAPMTTTSTAGSTANVPVNVTTAPNTATTGPQNQSTKTDSASTASANGGNGTGIGKGGAGGAGGGGGSATGKATAGVTGSGNGGGAQLDLNAPVSTGATSVATGPTELSTTNNTSNRTSVLYVNLPTAPPVAPTVTGTGAIAVTSTCGELKVKVRKPIDYLMVGHFGAKTIQLAGQDTDVLESVNGDAGEVKKYEVVDNGDGTFSEMGTIYTEAAIIISASVSKQFGIGGFGGIGGGSASNGVSGTITGTERIIALGGCEHRRYKVVTVTPAFNPDQGPPGEPTYNQVKQKAQDLGRQNTELTEHPITK